jgi:RNA polymerase sigma-70 factor (ECF subfamily)
VDAGTGPEKSMISDGDLVRQSLAGRAAAYEELVRRWAGRITALCHAKLGCAATADDVAQETLLRGYRALQSLSEPDRFGAWLSTIARNNCINWLRSRQRTQVTFTALGHGNNLEGVLSSQSYEEEPELDRDDEARKLRSEVSALPQEFREVLTLYYHHEMTYREMAQVLGISPATINARLTKARGLLRERLTKCSS